MLQTLTPYLLRVSRSLDALRRLVMLLVLAALVPAARAAAPTAKRSYDIASGDAATTLRQFVEQSGEQVIYVVPKVRGVKTNPVKGELTAREALARMVADTDLGVVEDEKTGALMVNRTASPNRPDTHSPADPKPTSEKTSITMKRKNPIALLAAWLGLTLGSTSPVRAADGNPASANAQHTASILGTVTSAETGKGLQGAIVSIPALNRHETTDSAGRFVLQSLPEGTLDVVVSYSGTEERRQTIVAGIGEQSVSFELKLENIITLDKFTVAAEREGNTLADTEQKNATNLKNVIAMDAFGNLPTSNVGDIMMRLPGVTGVIDGQGRVQGVSVRGMPSGMTTTTIDGVPALRGQSARETDLTGMTGNNFEVVEVIKGHTPDRSANSLGGTINLKTASPLNMKEKRQFTYGILSNWAPSFLEHSFERLRHPLHPTIDLGYKEVFDVGGGKRNLGIAINLFYIEQANAADNESYSYNNATQGPAYIYNYVSVTNMVNKHVTTGSVKLEYQPNARNKFQLGLLYNKEDTPAATNSAITASTSQSVATIGPDGQPTGNGAILPGYSETQTQVRGLAASTLTISDYVLDFYAKTPSVNFSGEHRLGNFKIDYKVSETDSHVDAGSGNSGPKGNKGEGGMLTYNATNIGWTIDRTDSAHPRFTQTAGPSIYNLASYNGSIQQTNRSLTLDNQVRTAELNTAYQLQDRFQTVVKSGLYYEGRINGNATRVPGRWDRVAGAPLLPDVMIFGKTNFDERQGGNLPTVDPRATNAQLSNPALWTPDPYYRESQRLIGTKKATELVSAGYLMVRSKIGRLHVIGGTRIERTDFAGEGNVKRTSATAAQIPDPIARAAHDWGNHLSTKGNYTNSFPSLHLAYDLSPSLKAMASWSTSIGRPPQSALMPSAAANLAAQTVTMSNPGLKPQFAKNIDFGLQYYFRPAGRLSFGFFKKNLKDFILTTLAGNVGSGSDNGFGGDYAGYALYSQTNAGSAEAQGWECDYRQQMTFLPGFLKGLELGGNLTAISTEGDFGGATNRTSSAVPGFVPRTANVSLGYTYGRIGTRINYSYISDCVNTYSAQPALSVFKDKLNLVTASVFFKLRGNTTISVDMTNVFAERRATYQYVPSRTSQIFTPNQKIIVGVRGRF
ncbi:MAG: TonB-dependent receptor [Verrucomicrobia bacterium]|nr:TonB-dependent receptor [Verrucomicrobiota bacterium]